jgi:outer membrane protein assembly factor BamB
VYNRPEAGPISERAGLGECMSTRGSWSVAFATGVLICAAAVAHGAVAIASADESTDNAAAPRILWSYDLKAPSFGSSAVGDIDGDGKPEIVFGTYFNDQHVYALNAEDGSLLWKHDTGGCNDASPAIADVDLDGKLEVIIPASSPCKCYCFDGATGAVKWSADTGSGNCIDSPPAVADLDNDRKPEVIFGTFGGFLFCLNGEDGSVCWKTNLGSESCIQSGPSICDLNGDKQLDVVVAQWRGDHRICGVKGSDGSVLWSSDLPADNMYHGASIADIDEDGKPEIAIGSYDHHVYVLNGEDGSRLWDYEAPYYVGAPTAIADLNNDRHLEIVFAADTKVGVLSHTGSLLWSYTAGGGVFRGAAIADVDGNGVLDIVFGGDDGKLTALSGDDGHVVWTIDLAAHYGKTYQIGHAPVIADLDGDGKLDVFVVGGLGRYPAESNHGRAYAVAAGEGKGPGWPMFRNDLRHSGFVGRPPNAPRQPLGPTQGVTGKPYRYNTAAVDPDGDRIRLLWDWGDGTTSGWRGSAQNQQPSGCSHHMPAGRMALRLVARVDHVYGHLDRLADAQPVVDVHDHLHVLRLIGRLALELDTRGHVGLDVTLAAMPRIDDELPALGIVALRAVEGIGLAALDGDLRRLGDGDGPQVLLANRRRDLRAHNRGGPHRRLQTRPDGVLALGGVLRKRDHEL